MVDVDELRGKLAARNVTQTKMAEILNITPKTFASRMKKKMFMSDEIDIMVSVLKLDKDEAWKIFFAK